MSPSAIQSPSHFPRVDLVECSNLSYNSTTLRCTGIGNSSSVYYCEPVAGSRGEIYDCQPAGFLFELFRAIVVGFANVFSCLFGGFLYATSPINELTRTYPLATGIPLLMMGGPDLLALLYWALSMMQKTLRPFAQGRNFYLTQMVGDRPPDYSLLPQGRRDFPTPTIHLTITLAGASVGLWGVFIIGRFLSAL